MKSYYGRDVFLAAALSAVLTGLVSAIFFLFVFPMFTKPYARIGHHSPKAEALETRIEASPSVDSTAEQIYDDSYPLDAITGYIVSGDIERLKEAFPPDCSMDAFEDLIPQSRELLALLIGKTERINYTIVKEKQIGNDKKELTCAVELDTEKGQHRFDAKLTLQRIEGKWYLDPHEISMQLKQELLVHPEYFAR